MNAIRLAGRRPHLERARRHAGTLAPALVSVAAAISLLAGCSSVSGVGGDTEFSCAAGKGVPCQSITGNNNNFEANNLPFQRREDPGAKKSEKGDAAPAPERRALNYHAPADVSTAQAARPDRGMVSPSVMAAPSTGVPIRTPERILRVWLAPAEMPDGTFEDQRYVYVTVAPGRWLIEMNREQLNNRYQPVRNISPASAAQPPASAARSPSDQARDVVQPRSGAGAGAPGVGVPQ